MVTGSPAQSLYRFRPNWLLGLQVRTDGSDSVLNRLEAMRIY